MDYEKKYKEALERAKKLKENPKAIFLEEENVHVSDYIFPELKESEDERIRKEIVRFIQMEVEDEIVGNKWIAWLEGLCKPNPYSGVSFDYNGHIWGMCARDNGVEILFDGELKAFLSLEKSFIYPIHPQPELAPKSALEAINEEMTENANYVKPKFKVKYANNEYNVLEIKEIAGVTYFGIEDEPNHIDYVLPDNCEIVNDYGIKEKGSPYPTKLAVFSDNKPQDKSTLETVKEEKVDNANKVKPKYDVGCWIVCNETIVKIVDCDNNRYTIETTEGLRWAALIDTVDRDFHLWTIKDAKGGDVLVNGSNIFIFHFINDTRLMGYCHVNTDNGRFSNDVGKIECFGLIDAVFIPATKEQRDLLFSKMYDAGYEWDEEKLELKKIASDNAEQDESPLIWHDATKELPPKRKGSDLSEYVLVYDQSGDVFLSSYDYEEKSWRHGNVVSHWAYIPELPKTD